MRRRELLAGAAAVLVAGRAEEPGASAAPWSSGSETPRLEAPPGATDCHHYVYDHLYPRVLGYDQASGRCDTSRLSRADAPTRHQASGARPALRIWRR